MNNPNITFAIIEDIGAAIIHRHNESYNKLYGNIEPDGLTSSEQYVTFRGKIIGSEFVISNDDNIFDSTIITICSDERVETIIDSSKMKYHIINEFAVKASTVTSVVQGFESLYMWYKHEKEAQKLIFAVGNDAIASYFDEHLKLQDVECYPEEPEFDIDNDDD